MQIDREVLRILHLGDAELCKLTERCEEFCFSGIPAEVCVGGVMVWWCLCGGGGMGKLTIRTGYKDALPAISGDMNIQQERALELPEPRPEVRRYEVSGAWSSTKAGGHPLAMQNHAN